MSTRHFGHVAFKLFYAARQNAVLRRSPFPYPNPRAAVRGVPGHPRLRGGIQRESGRRLGRGGTRHRRPEDGPPHGEERRPPSTSNIIFHPTICHSICLTILPHRPCLQHRLR